MRFVLYNVRYATGTGFRFHLPFPFAGFFRRTGRRISALANYFRSLCPDILGLVEIDSGSYRTAHASQADILASRLGQHAACRAKYAPRSLPAHIPLLRRQANACLCTTHPNARYHFLHRGVKRLVIELRLPRISLFLVHLALGRRARAAQLDELARLIRRAARPCIVAGDFNAFAGRAELARFMHTLNLSSANAHDEPTYPAKSPRLQLDYILHSPQIHVTRFSVGRGIHLSDHLPLICDFEVAA